MEVWKIVGYRKLDFTGGDGKAVKGYNLYLAREPVTKGIIGLEVHRLFVPFDLIDEPVENSMITVTYNRYGKVASIVPYEG